MRLKCLVFASLWGAAGLGVAGPPAKPAKKIAFPNVEMVTTAGKRLTVASLRGKVVLFDFWATWCGPCKAASPYIQKLYETYGKKGLVVIGADGLESAAGPQGAIKYAKEHHYTYTFTYGNDMLEQSMGIQAIPAFVLVDKRGYIANAQVGIPSGNPAGVYVYFAPKIKKLLSE